MKHMLLRMSCAALALLSVAVEASAQDRFPSRPVQVIVPATPGGPVDTAVRMIEPGLAAAFGGPVALVNRPGASGTVGMQSVATAEPSGYTIGQGVNSIFTIAHVFGTKVPFTLDNFTLLGNYAMDVSVLAVHPDAPWKTFDDVIAHVRSNPGKMTYASAGVGTVSSLSMEALQNQFKLEMLAVPFQGGAQLTAAILGRHVDIGMVPYSSGGPLFRENKLRALATTAPARMAQFPDLPTIVEKGIKANGLNLIMGLYAPKGLPDSVEKFLVSAVSEAIKNPTSAAAIDRIGLLTHYEGPAEARQRLETEARDILALSQQLKK